MRPRRINLGLLTLVFGCAGLTGCTTTTPGHSQAVGQTKATQAGGSAAPSAAASPLAKFDPCRLIKKSQGSPFGIVSAKPIDGDGLGEAYKVRGCTYETTTDTSVSAYLRDAVGISGKDEHADGSPRKVTLAGHPAKLQRELDGACVVTYGYTEHTSFDIAGVNKAGDQDKACQFAQKVAPLVADTILGN